MLSARLAASDGQMISRWFRAVPQSTCAACCRRAPCRRRQPTEPPPHAPPRRQETEVDRTASNARNHLRRGQNARNGGELDKIGLEVDERRAWFPRCLSASASARHRLVFRALTVHVVRLTCIVRIAHKADSRGRRNTSTRRGGDGQAG